MNIEFLIIKIIVISFAILASIFILLKYKDDSFVKRILLLLNLIAFITFFILILISAFNFDLIEPSDCIYKTSKNKFFNSLPCEKVRNPLLNWFDENIKEFYTAICLNLFGAFIPLFQSFIRGKILRISNNTLKIAFIEYTIGSTLIFSILILIILLKKEHLIYYSLITSLILAIVTHCVIFYFSYEVPIAKIWKYVITFLISSCIILSFYIFSILMTITVYTFGNLPD
ncbi:hypothetical protein [Leptospira kanakyensis]|uniref:hypothetical protein n=1 Tax=Leptospira kanakyensis TaxID=2484968 RepID=UPI00223E1CA1|nr:hypothetical protein [Leptospira kanakyensis]MCW7471855.1 hypothetical protein [Leptospira kanakyensis]